MKKRDKKSVEFDFKYQQNIGNQFWKQGQGRIEHREKEMAAK